MGTVRAAVVLLLEHIDIYQRTFPVLSWQCKTVKAIEVIAIEFNHSMFQIFTVVAGPALGLCVTADCRNRFSVQTCVLV